MPLLAPLFCSSSFASTLGWRNASPTTPARRLDRLNPEPITLSGRKTRNELGALTSIMDETHSKSGRKESSKTDKENCPVQIRNSWSGTSAVYTALGWRCCGS
jgi:hypothetical protein